MEKKQTRGFFLEKYPTHKKKFKECLKLNSWNGFFHFAIIKLRLQLRYLAYEQSFKTWDKLLFMPTRDTLPKSDLYTSGKYADFTKPVFLSFSQSLNKFLDCGASLSCPVRFDLCPTNPSVTVSFGHEQCEFLDRMDFDAIFQRINLRYQWAIWVYTPEI